MSTEIRNNIFTSVATAIILAALGLFYNTIHSEIDTYSKIKDSLPQIEELNIVRKDLENEYKANKSKVNAELWELKNDIKKIKQKQSKDSSYIYWNYAKVYNWTYGNE